MSLPKEIASSQELLEAQAHVWNHISNYVNSMCLKCAIQLGIPDAIHKHGNPTTLSQLVDALPINKAKSEGLFRLMRILVHSKFFEKVRTSSGDGEEEEAYSLTPASRLLLRSDTLNMGPVARFLIDPIAMEPWHYLSGWFCNDLDTPFETKHGRTFWEYVSVEKEFNMVFNEAMACDAGFVTCILNNEFAQVFEGVESMVDVGGGTGATAKAIAAANPGLKCVVFDLPHVVGGLHGCENLSFVSGDMYECIPQADAIFMKFILHDWDDEECVRILKKCKEALTTPSNKGGGKVIIIEIVMKDENETYEAAETKLFMDMQMLNLVKGKERSEEEWAKLFLTAGFSNYKVARLLGLRSVIEVFP